MMRSGLHLRRLPVVAAVAACALALPACGATDNDGAARKDPAAAVRDFLIDGAIDGNGYEACTYLTAAQKSAAARTGGGGCRNAMNDAGLTLGGKAVTTLHQVERLPMIVTVDGDRAHVRVSQNGASVGFELVRADAADRNEFDPPDTDWRIAAGVRSVVPATQLP